MTGTISSANKSPDVLRAAHNFARLMTHVARLYCAGATSSVSACEAHELALSVTFALGIAEASHEEAAHVLDVEDPIELWHEAVCTLDERTDAAMELWQKVVATMPPIHNVSLRDTLASLGELKSRYDTRFSAHEVPCNIDYQLHEPVDPHLLGIDYVEAWLRQLLVEARWLAQFDMDSCLVVLERICPDYRGLHINLCDLLMPHEAELTFAKVDCPR